MLKDYVVAETVTHFHLVRAEEDLIEAAIKTANSIAHCYDTGYEALDKVLNGYKSACNAEYEVISNFCGTEVENIELVEEHND